MTNPTNNGPNELGKPTAERIKDLDASLDAYEAELGLPRMVPFANESEVTSLFGMSAEDLRNMSREQQAEAVVLLEDYQVYLQRVINRLQARINWCNYHIDRMIAPKIMQYKGYSVEERRMQAVRDNDAACRTEDIRQQFLRRLETVSFLPNRVEHLARSLGFYLMRKNYGNFPT